MPFINIAVAGTVLSDSQKQHLFGETTRLMSEVMGKDPNLTSVCVDEYPAGSWAIGSTPVEQRNEVAVHMDIKVTDGTNTDQQKAEMISQAMAMLKDVTGGTAEASYIVIHDLSAETWGYDGRTQGARTREREAA